jgi:hypothetical protein
MSTITEPEVARRSWVYIYRRPAVPGWPLVVRKGWPEGNRADKLIKADDFRIKVTQVQGEEPVLEQIFINGSWPNGNPVRMVRVRHDGGLADLCVHAPDWVMELAADAIERSRAEIVVTDPFAGEMS